MRILKLKFENINSLGGEWTIDFEHEDFRNNSMFCIAGPTGSGKTSILDAICLALYGRTPRQTPTGSANEVMTNGEKSCYASVTLDVDGVRYTATWSQKKTKNDSFKAYEWQLLNESTGVAVSVSKTSEIEKKIVNCIGLKYDEFTKSVLLAQGKFSRFLESSEKERASVLEKLTGDSSYRNLAKAVYALNDKMEKDIEAIRNQMNGVVLMSNQELADLNNNLAALNGEKVSLEASVKNLERIVGWFRTLHEKEAKLTVANTKCRDAETAKANFELDEKKLSRALDAHEVEASHVAYRNMQDGIVSTQGRLNECQEKLVGATAAKDSAVENANKASEKASAAEADYSQKEPLWTEVESLDATIVVARKNVTDARNVRDEAQNKVSDQVKKIQDLDQKIADEKTCLKKYGEYEAQHQKDGSIGEILPLLNSKIVEFNGKKSGVGAAETVEKAAEAALEKFKNGLEDIRQKLADDEKYLSEHSCDGILKDALPELKVNFQKVTQLESDKSRYSANVSTESKLTEQLSGRIAELDVTISNLKSEKESIIQNDIPVIVAELRSRISEGDACPVCGSREHPACHDAENHVENGATALNDFAQKLKAIDAGINDAEIKKQGVKAQQDSCKERLSENSDKLAEVKSEQATLLAQLNETLKPWNSVVEVGNVQSIEKMLVSFKEAYEATLNEKTACENRLRESAVEQTRLEADLSAKSAEKVALLEAVATLSKELENAFSPWFANFRDEDVDALLRQLQKRKADWDTNDSCKSKCESELNADVSVVGELRAGLTNAEADLKNASDKLDEVQKICVAREATRKEKFGDKIVAEERSVAARNRDDLKAFARSAEEARQKALTIVNTLNTQIQECQKHLKEDGEKLVSLKQNFDGKLQAKNFADEAEFLKARLSEAERNVLSARKKTIDDDLLAAKTSQGEFKKSLDEHLATRDFDMQEDVASQTLEKDKNSLQEKVDGIANLNAQKSQDASNRQRCAGLQARIDQMKPRADMWKKMHEWFGQKSGDDFVEFVQRISMKNLLKLSNRHLSAMYPRYEMICKDLDIQLIDHDNSNSVRPVTNISGGEGFLVSLSLALGISAMASRKVQIDSMFLDEGFGTLDSQKLQETIEVLRNLQHEEGKSLGIITHVGAIQEELRLAHIDVAKVGRGRSVLSGSGVSHG